MGVTESWHQTCVSCYLNPAWMLLEASAGALRGDPSAWMLLEASAGALRGDPSEVSCSLCDSGLLASKREWIVLKYTWGNIQTSLQEVEKQAPCVPRRKCEDRRRHVFPLSNLRRQESIQRTTLSSLAFLFQGWENGLLCSPSLQIPLNLSVLRWRCRPKTPSPQFRHRRKAVAFV